MPSCADCGVTFESLGHGRPRKKCAGCAPSKAIPVGKVELACLICESPFTARPDARYCSAKCRSLATRSQPCTGCSKRMEKSRSSASAPYCIECRRAGKAPSNATHGLSRYRVGCRCDVCKSAVTLRQRNYVTQRAAEGRPIDYRSRSLKSADCEACGIAFMARPDTAARFCSMLCAGNAHGRRDGSKRRPKIAKSVRLRIFESAGYVCQLCQAPTRPDEESNHPRYPTLDHIAPYSRGGSDDEENLRLACRQCNTLRGANEQWVPEKASEVA